MVYIKKKKFLLEHQRSFPQTTISASTQIKHFQEFKPICTNEFQNIWTLNHVILFDIRAKHVDCASESSYDSTRKVPEEELTRKVLTINNEDKTRKMSTGCLFTCLQLNLPSKKAFLVIKT